MCMCEAYICIKWQNHCMIMMFILCATTEWKTNHFRIGRKNVYLCEHFAAIEMLWNDCFWCHFRRKLYTTPHLIRFVCTFFTHWVAKELRATYIFVAYIVHTHPFIMRVSVNDALRWKTFVWWKPWKMVEAISKFYCGCGNKMYHWRSCCHFIPNANFIVRCSQCAIWTMNPV